MTYVLLENFIAVIAVIGLLTAFIAKNLQDQIDELEKQLEEMQQEQRD